jgi:threonine aldolase
VQALEARTAALVGQEAGLFTPSGSMANLVALMTHLGRGDRFYAVAGAHVLTHELGTSAWLAGGLPSELPWTVAPGVPGPETIDAAAAEEPAPAAYYDLTTKLVCLENTHNHAGGTVIPRAVADNLSDAVHRAGWSLHLDGARLWHAAAAQGISPAAAAGAADSVTVCFSKGLGAPVGSMLCGSEAFIRRAWRSRKALGGGMRQAGVLAAAALVALDQELPRIDEDRVRARVLAQAIRAAGVDCPEPQTNILVARPAEGSDLTARALWQAWDAAGIGCFLMGGMVRLVLHRDIDDEALATAVDLVAHI